MEDMIREGYDYIVSVLEKQERWLSCHDMWRGYKSLFPGKLTKHGFEVLYNEMKNAVEP